MYTRMYIYIYCIWKLQFWVHCVFCFSEQTIDVCVLDVHNFWTKLDTAVVSQQQKPLPIKHRWALISSHSDRVLDAFIGRLVFVYKLTGCIPM